LDRWKRARVASSQGDDEPFPAFPIQVPCTEQGIEFPKRHERLRVIVEELETRRHPTLLLVEIGVLDYLSPAMAPADHPRISEVGRERLAWLTRWINERTQSTLDLLLYSRNRDRCEAFLDEGLPRRGERIDGPWPSAQYTGRNLTRLSYPCGRWPWGDHFGGDPGFAPIDGTPGDRPERRRRYATRTLRALLRGDGPDGSRTRLRHGSVRPVPPPRPSECGHRIDRDFWAQVDATALEAALQREYFGASDVTPVTKLLEAVEYMRQTALDTPSPDQFHQLVVDRWSNASRMLLWGPGGAGKSYLGKLLGPLLFGEEPLVVACNEGSRHASDPAGGFKANFFGSPPGYVGSDVPSRATAHLIRTRGFSVVVLDEVDHIAGSFTASVQALYSLLEDRSFLPQNPALVGHRPISLWNTVFVMTANLAEFPPPDVQGQDRQAIQRRLTDHPFPAVDLAYAQRFARWHLVRRAEQALGGVARCHCDPLPEFFGRLQLRGANLDSLGRELDPLAERLRSAMVQDGLQPSSCPLFCDVTPYVRAALA